MKLEILKKYAEENKEEDIINIYQITGTDRYFGISFSSAELLVVNGENLLRLRMFYKKEHQPFELIDDDAVWLLDDHEVGFYNDENRVNGVWYTIDGKNQELVLVHGQDGRINI